MVSILLQLSIASYMYLRIVDYEKELKEYGKRSHVTLSRLR